MRFAFIAKHRHIWPVSWLCEVLEVSRSGFHAWLNRPLSDRAILDAKLVAAIDTSFKARACRGHRDSGFPGDLIHDSLSVRQIWG